ISKRSRWKRWIVGKIGLLTHSIKNKNTKALIMLSTNTLSHKSCPLCGPRNPLTLVNRLEAMISTCLYANNTMPTSAEAAVALGMSTRTLARALLKEGTTFLEVSTQLRKQIAVSCLKDGRMTVSQIGWQLGF